MNVGTLFWTFIAGMQGGYIAWRLWPEWWSNPDASWPLPFELGFLGFLAFRAWSADREPQ